ncbi:MAG: hypothetical protein MJ062_02350 [Oscillospiraceae bacterium]|nr:hypothetical protein [Oscillospiraceae bacterium]
MKAKAWISLLLCGCMLTACGRKEQEMQYVKTSVFYATVMDMYNYPKDYLGGQYHFVGELYESTDDESGEVFYSVYGKNPTDSDEGIGIQLVDCSFDGLQNGDEITVEGTLDSEKDTVGGEEKEFLVLRVSMIEKREK